MFRNHVCLTFPLASINLYDLIKRNHFKGLSLRLIRRFAQQITTGLAFLHIQGVCHADMKPENVLLRHPNRSGVDIIDLGSSLFEGQIVYTYIQVSSGRGAAVCGGEVGRHVHAGRQELRGREAGLICPRR